MNSNIFLPGFEDDVIITKTEERDGVYAMWVEVERKAHSCPDCGELTDKKS